MKRPTPFVAAALAALALSTGCSSPPPQPLETLVPPQLSTWAKARDTALYCDAEDDPESVAGLFELRRFVRVDADLEDLPEYAGDPYGSATWTRPNLARVHLFHDAPATGDGALRALHCVVQQATADQLPSLMDAYAPAFAQLPILAEGVIRHRPQPDGSPLVQSEMDLELDPRDGDWLILSTAAEYDTGVVIGPPLTLQVLEVSDGSDLYTVRQRLFAQTLERDAAD